MAIDPTTGIISGRSVAFPDEFFHQFFLRRLLQNFQKDQICETEFVSGRSSTYGWVLDSYRRVARWLHERGVGVGDRVSFYSSNFIEYIPCAMAVLRIGATLSYIRPEMIKDKDYRAAVGIPRFVFASPDRVEELISAGYENIIVFRAQELPPTCYSFDETINAPEGNTEELDFEIPGSPKSVIALVTFTGGTTGNPKPIQLTHRSLVSVLAAEASGTNSFFGSPLDKPIQLCQFPTVHLTGLLYRVFSLVYHPHTVLLETNAAISDICKAIEKYKVNTMTTIPVTLIAISRFPERPKYDLSSWKNCVLVGGSLLPFVQDDLYEIFNLDGLYLRLAMSECSGNVMVPSLVRGSVGRLAPNTEAIVRNLKDGSPITTPGEIGELTLRGPQRTIGYYNLPKKTAEAIDSEGFLHTGDLVSFDADCNFYYFDRAQEFIRHRETGRMISSQELELTIAYLNGGVQEVSVIASAKGPRAIVVPTAWPEDEEAFKDSIVEKTNAHITEEWRKLTGGVALLKKEHVPRTVLGKHLKRMMSDM